MGYFRFTDGLPFHGYEIAELRGRALVPGHSPLESAAMLATTELLHGHQEGSFEICRHSYCLSLLAHALGRPFEVIHNEFDVSRRVVFPVDLTRGNEPA